MAVEKVVGVEEGHFQVFGIQDVPDDVYLSVGGICRTCITCHSSPSKNFDGQSKKSSEKLQIKRVCAAR